MRVHDYRPLRKTPPGFARPASRRARAGEAGHGDGADESSGDGTFEEGDIWRLQFWPSPGNAEPPRWLTRFEPVTVAADEDGEDSAGAPDGGAAEPGERLYDTYGELAADLVAVALWTPGGAVGTVADLAARVLASPGKVRAGLRAAVSAGHLRVAGDLGGDGAPLTLTPLPPPPPDHGPPQSLWAEDLGSLTEPAFTDVLGTLERLLSAGMARRDIGRDRAAPPRPPRPGRARPRRRGHRVRRRGLRGTLPAAESHAASVLIIRTRALIPVSSS